MTKFVGSIPGPNSSLRGLNKEAIVGHMLAALRAGGYWDCWAKATYPKKEFGGDDVDDMAKTWGMHWDTPQFDARLVLWANARYDEVCAKLAAVPLTGQGYRLHRVMRVPQKWIDRALNTQKARLGFCWTYALKEWDAYSIWSRHKKGLDILIEGLVAPENVDWAYTVLANMDWLSGDREHEMRVQPKAPVAVSSISHYDEDLCREGEALPVDGIRFVA